MKSRDEYERDVCLRLQSAEVVRFLKVSLPKWSPRVGGCHDNVDRWVEANSGFAVVRGWVTYIDFQIKIRLTAHSVVRDALGRLFDITPLGNECVRSSMKFVPHLGTEEEFRYVMTGGIEIDCVCRGGQ